MQPVGDTATHGAPACHGGRSSTSSVTAPVPGCSESVSGLATARESAVMVPATVPIMRRVLDVPKKAWRADEN